MLVVAGYVGRKAPMLPELATLGPCVRRRRGGLEPEPAAMDHARRPPGPPIVPPGARRAAGDPLGNAGACGPAEAHGRPALAPGVWPRRPLGARHRALIRGRVSGRGASAPLPRGL
eukprot:4912326-Lingulodinium_polyedra.AAC.1